MKTFNVCFRYRCCRAFLRTTHYLYTFDMHQHIHLLLVNFVAQKSYKLRAPCQALDDTIYMPQATKQQRLTCHSASTLTTVVFFFLAPLMVLVQQCPLLCILLQMASTGCSWLEHAIDTSPNTSARKRTLANFSPSSILSRHTLVVLH